MALIKQQVGANITNIDSTPMILSPGMRGKGKTLHLTPGSKWEAIPLQWLCMGGNSLTMASHGRQFPYNASTWEAILIQSPPVQFRWGYGVAGREEYDLKVHTPTAF